MVLLSSTKITKKKKSMFRQIAGENSYHNSRFRLLETNLTSSGQENKRDHQNIDLIVLKKKSTTTYYHQNSPS